MEQICLFNQSIWKVFEVFVDEPLKIHYIKEISRKINLAPTSVKKYLLDMEKQKILMKKTGERFEGYIANRDGETFLFSKKIFNIVKLNSSGIINYIIENIHPKSIVLYGSYFRGEDVNESDIDLFILSNVRKNFDLDKFEKLLKRKIHIIIENNFKKINPNLQMEIINGQILFGYLKNE